MLMEAADLIARENEFKKLNKQLEKKTETLMKEIEQVMQKPDIFSEFSNRLSKSQNRITKKQICDSPTSDKSNYSPNVACAKIKKEKCDSNKGINVTDTDKNEQVEARDNIKKCVSNVCDWCSLTSKRNDEVEFLYAFVSVNVKDNVLPQTFLKERVSVESVCKFLSAKVTLLQEQIDKLQGTVDRMAKQCDAHMCQLAGVESERLALTNRANGWRSETADVRAKHAALLGRLHEKDRLYKEQRSQTDKLAVEAKSLRAKNASLEARTASQEETIATLKHQAETTRLAEKEFRDSTRNLSSSHQNAIARLETKVKSLTARIDKQNALVDNLKKQNALLATEGALKALEREYNDFLNSDFE